MSTPPTVTLEQRLRRLEDLEAIRTLHARYTRVLDASDWDGLVDCFTTDGEFHGLDHARGHEQLRTFFAGLAAAGLTQFWHHITNLEIDLDGDVAHLRSLLWQPCVQDGVPHVAAGRYTDVAVRDGDAWRYRSRTIDFSYFVPLTEGWQPNSANRP
jgi:ketosteroid isomerase-like protein